MPGNGDKDQIFIFYYTITSLYNITKACHDSTSWLLDKHLLLLAQEGSPGDSGKMLFLMMILLSRSKFIVYLKRAEA